VGAEVQTAAAVITADVGTLAHAADGAVRIALNTGVNTCANHGQRFAAGRCVQCEHLFCDSCCAFLINGEAWCEPCGDNERRVGRGNKPLALIVLLIGLGLWLAMIAYQVSEMDGFFQGTAYLVFIPLLIAWPIAYPPGGGHRPTIVDRRLDLVALPPMRARRPSSSGHLYGALPPEPTRQLGDRHAQ
jgi:hypothetical protein